VGPNGSGKSNVIDAMLFVFGKRAKKLRLNKVSELIHSSDNYAIGTENELGFARVNVFFSEIQDDSSEDDYEIIPGTEVVVSRIARRDNSSNYLIDGKNASFKKVAEYLGDKGIDLDNNRFLILQGEVEMISMMPPKGKGNDDDGLLEYLEDIIGSNKYVEDTNAAAAKVEQLTEVRQEKLNRVKAAEKEVQALSGAKMEAMSLVTKDREIRRKRNILFQISSMLARKEAEEAKGEKEGLVEKLEEERARLAEADERVNQIEDGMTEQRNEYEAIYSELSKTKDAYTKFERQDIQMKENIKFEKSNVKKLEEKVVTETKRGEDAEVALAEAEESIPSLEERIEECAAAREEEDAKLDEIYAETKETTEQLRKELEEKTQKLAPLLQERSVFQNSFDTAQMEVNLLEDGVSRAKEQLVRAETELASMDDKEAAKKKEMQAYEDELRQGKERVEVAEKEVGDLEKTEGVLAKKSSELLVSIA
jgi:structural maintenance of chromosome 4